MELLLSRQLIYNRYIVTIPRNYAIHERVREIKKKKERKKVSAHSISILFGKVYFHCEPDRNVSSGTIYDYTQRSRELAIIAINEQIGSIIVNFVCFVPFRM